MNDMNPTMQQTTYENRFGGSLTPYGEDLDRKLERAQKQIEAERRARECEAKDSMKNKLARIAELFELDVLSEDDALKACKTVIEQHAKAKPIQNLAEKTNITNK